MDRTVSWWWIPAVLLITLAVCTRLPAPWQMDVTNDEMHHLESWRNRYKSDDVYPLFLQKLETKENLSPARLELIRKLYRSSPLVPHALLVLVDPQPPIFPTLAEITAKLTDSSLIALRLWSVAFSLLAIWIGYITGREIAGHLCGLWLAILVCIGAVTQYFAGIGRPYALTQLTILLAIWAFVRRQKDQTTLPRFLGWCLLAQAVQWMAWAVVGPMVIVELLRRWRAGATLPHLARQTWWYALVSVVLLMEMFIQARNPVVTRQGGLMPLWFVWASFSTTAPTGHLGSFGNTSLHIGGAVIAALGIAGAISLLRRRQAYIGDPVPAGFPHLPVQGRSATSYPLPVEGGSKTSNPLPLGGGLGRGSLVAGLGSGWTSPSTPAGNRTRQHRPSNPWLHAGLVAAAAGGVLASIVVGVTARFQVSYTTPWLVLTAVGLWALIPRPRAALATATAVLLAFGWLTFFHPQDPFTRIADYDVRWSQVAAVLKTHQRPDGRWIGFAPSIACNLYRYGPFPEPIAPFKMQELQQLLDSGQVACVPIVLELDGNYPGMADLIKTHVQVIKSFPAGTDGYAYIVGKVLPSQPDMATSR